MPETDSMLAERYRLGGRIGSGGMAEVFRAEDVALDRPVAVKMLRPGLDVGDAPLRLAAEVRVLARLSHPGLVSFYDAGESDHRGFLVMQLVEGGTLADTLTEAPLPAARVAGIGRQLAGVLAYLHGQGLVHRDVKPSNVLLVEGSGQVLLTDFGIARALDAERLTATHTTVGTAAYMAPEQVTGGAVGPAVDVYALGLVLLQCLTGETAFQGRNTLEVAEARLHGPPPVPAGVRSLPWAGLLEEMTRSDPEHRPTAARVVEVLEDPDAASPQSSAHTTAVLPLPPARDEPTAAHAVPGAVPPAEHGDDVAWPAPDVVPDAATSRGGWLTAPFRGVWRRRDRAVHLRADVVVVSGLVLLGLVVLLVVVASHQSAPRRTPPTPTTTPTPGASRLPADLDRLDRAVNPG